MDSKPAKVIKPVLFCFEMFYLLGLHAEMFPIDEIGVFFTSELGLTYL